MTHGDDATDAAWAAFVAEATALRRRAHEDPYGLEAGAAERLGAMSDPLVHLAATVDAAGAPRRDGDADAGRDAARRHALVARIVAGLHARRLGVREIDGAPPLHRMARSVPVDARLLASAERAHAAVRPMGVAIAAGGGRLLDGAECDALVPVPNDLPRGRYLALEVRGDSMEPLFHSGDTVLVQLGAAPAHGAVVVARDPDHGYVLKEVGSVRAGLVELRSLNPAFPTLRVPAAEGAVLGTVLLRWCPHARLTA
jgi:SOS-response transcriptional repressor LexA